MNFRNKVVVAVGLGLLVMGALGVLSYLTVVRTQNDRNWVIHTHLVLETLNGFLADVMTAETTERGLILTADPSYRRAFDDAVKSALDAKTELRTLTADNPAQQRNLDRLDPPLSARFAELRSRVEIATRGNPKTAAEAVRQGSGERLTNQIRALIAEMKNDEKGLLTQRVAEANASTERTKIVIVIGNAVAVFFLLLAAAVIRREMAQRQYAENEVRALNVDLERRVEARTSELAQQKRELERSNLELQQFAYVASHDLQEPLRMVASFTQLLAKRYGDKLGDDAREFIAFAVDGARRMQTLISDLLAYSRVGTQGRELAPIDCGALLRRVQNNLMLSIKDSQAVVTSDPLPVVLGDDIQLGQLFQNLLVNAMKFRSGEIPRIHISAERLPERAWKISVRDNGIGIAPEHSERIFVIFQRLHTKSEYPGTGIGLAICKKIVERHGGKIWFEPSPGGGSTFNFTLTAAEISARERQNNELRIPSTAR